MITKEGRSPINSLTDQVRICDEASRSANTPAEIASLFGIMATLGYSALQVLKDQQEQIGELQRTVRSLNPSFLGGPG